MLALKRRERVRERITSCETKMEGRSEKESQMMETRRTTLIHFNIFNYSDHVEKCSNMTILAGKTEHLENSDIQNDCRVINPHDLCGLFFVSNDQKPNFCHF